MKKNSGLFITYILGSMAYLGVSYGNQEQILLYSKAFGEQLTQHGKRAQSSRCQGYMPECMKGIGVRVSATLKSAKNRAEQWNTKKKITVAVGALAVVAALYNQGQILQFIGYFVRQPELQGQNDQQYMNVNKDELIKDDDFVKPTLQAISGKEGEELNELKDERIEQLIQPKNQSNLDAFAVLVKNNESDVELQKVVDEELEKLTVLAKQYEDTQIKAKIDRRDRFISPHKVTSWQKKDSVWKADLAETEFFAMLKAMQSSRKIISSAELKAMQSSRKIISSAE